MILFITLFLLNFVAACICFRVGYNLGRDHERDWVRRFGKVSEEG